jgi:hypothetical protein
VTFRMPCASVQGANYTLTSNTENRLKQYCFEMNSTVYFICHVFTGTNCTKSNEILSCNSMNIKIVQFGMQQHTV